MKAWGAKLVRIPTGYWNWVDLGDGVTPNAPDDVAARYKNLQSVKPSQHRTFIDQIVSYVEKYDMKFFFEMHGAPGSQNGEHISGCITGMASSGKPDHYFDTEWNKQIAVQTVGAMS